MLVQAKQTMDKILINLYLNYGRFPISDTFIEKGGELINFYSAIIAPLIVGIALAIFKLWLISVANESDKKPKQTPTLDQSVGVCFGLN